MRVSIIIVNWNGLYHLAPCLEHLQGQTFSDFEVIVVDNGSDDGSLPFLRERHPWVRVVELPENRGFATGNNVGYSAARGEYIITLNNDTLPEAGWLSALVAAADSSPEIGMVGSRICSAENPDTIDSLGVRICADGMSRGANRRQSYRSLDLSPLENILLPSACAALYKRKMIEETGFFSDDFFAYCEDTDLGLRGRWGGWHAILATTAVVYHKYSQTGGTFSPFKLYLVERNHYYAVIRNFPARFLFFLPVTTCFRFIRQAQVVMQMRGAGGEFTRSSSPAALLGAVLRGTMAALIRLPMLLRQRRSIMSNRKIKSREMVKLLQRYRMTYKELLDINE